MIYLRFGAILAVIVGFATLVAPLQSLLRRCGIATPPFSILFCRLMLRLLRVDVRRIGNAVPSRLVVANHVSWIDILALGALEPFCFLAKKEVSSWPGIASLARAQNTVFVDRLKRRTIPRANRQMAEHLNAGRSVLLFPEATTNRVVGRFHSAHLAAARDALIADPARDGVPVQPAAVIYDRDHAAWVGDAALLPHLWSIVSGPPIRCMVAFGDAAAFDRATDRKRLCPSLRVEVMSLAARAADAIGATAGPAKGEAASAPAPRLKDA